MTLVHSPRVNETYDPYLPDAERDKPPTEEYVRELLSLYGAYFRDFHSQCRTAENYYFGRNEVPVPETIPPIPPVRPSTARAIIETATDHVDVNNIDIQVPSSLRSRGRAEKIKKFYHGVWNTIKKPVLRTAVKQANRYGIAFLKPMFNADQWPGSPPRSEYISDAAYVKAVRTFLDDRCVKFPFDLQVVNPRNLVWDDSRVKRHWVIEHYQRDVRDIKKRYPQWLSSKNDWQGVTWVEYWDERWCGFMADGQWVWGPFEHGYGYVPYVAIEPSSSLEFDSGPPHLRYQGLLSSVLNLLDAEARLATQYESILRQYAWRTIDFHGDRRLAEDARGAYEMFDGKNIVPRGIEVKASPLVSPPQEILQMLNMVQTMIEEATFPNVIRGVRPRGVSSGFGVSVLAGMGRLKFQGIADGLARAVEQCNSSWAMLVENKLLGRVTVPARSEIHTFAQTIGPEDIKGLYENTVTMKAEAPEEREREALLAMRLYSAGLLTKYEGMKRAGSLAPFEDMVQQGAEQLAFSPEMQAQRLQIATEGVQMMQQLAAAGGGPAPGGGGLGPQQSPFGNEFQGLGGTPRLGESQIQQARIASQQGQPSVFPQGMGGMDNIARSLGTPQGGPTGMPSGQTIRRRGG